MTQLSETLSQLVQTLHTDISGKVDKITDGYSIYSESSSVDHEWCLRDINANASILITDDVVEPRTTLYNPNAMTQVDLRDGAAYMRSGNGYELEVGEEGVKVNGELVVTALDLYNVESLAYNVDAASLQRSSYALDFTSYVLDDVNALRDVTEASYAYTYDALVASYNALYAYVGEILTSLDGCLHVSDAPVYEYDAETATLNITTTTNE